MDTQGSILESIKFSFVALTTGRSGRSANLVSVGMTGGMFRRALLWILIGILPLQALCLVTAGFRGPAHVHESSPGSLADASVLAEHSHTHSTVERHHHDAADELILVDDGSDHQHEALAIDEAASSAGSLLSFTALLQRDPICDVPLGKHVRVSSNQKVPGPRTVDRIERPPAFMFG